jgi:hypothetical protein
MSDTPDFEAMAREMIESCENPRSDDHRDYLTIVKSYERGRASRDAKDNKSFVSLLSQIAAVAQERNDARAEADALRAQLETAKAALRSISEGSESRVTVYERIADAALAALEGKAAP